MACFIVPGAEAIVTTIAEKVIKKEEAKASESTAVATVEEASARTPFRKKLRWLNIMLWGGTALLLFEHIWHGEVTLWFPFLTAASSPADLSEMLHEMATTGVLMSVFITGIWGIMVAISTRLENRAIREHKGEEKA